MWTVISIIVGVVAGIVLGIVFIAWLAKKALAEVVGRQMW